MSRTAEILLVEDEPALADAISMNLELEGYQVAVATTGTDGLTMALKSKFDLIVLDVMLPGISGFDVCQEIRQNDTTTPILFLTAKGEGEDRVFGLKIGGDDYLTKPFHLEEFLLRVQKLLKRYAPQQKEDFTFSGHSIDFKAFTVKTKQGEVISLGAREAKLLELLTSNEGSVVSREAILNQVWGDDESPSSRTIDNFILGFRKYFENDPKHPVHFTSVRGVGYRFSR